jgi:GR25 family glycosyltransferase involved in LPS biosynthesis
MTNEITIYVINMSERKDRWQRIQNLFSKFFKLVRVEAVKHEEGWKGCFMSHKKCLQLAKEQNKRMIMVMEDDCVPFQNMFQFVTRLKLIKFQLERMKRWHIYLGGVFGIHPNSFFTFQKQNYASITAGFCTHFMIYNSNCYEFFLNHPIDKPIDHVWHNKLTALVSLPFLANQQNDYSNIRKKFVSDLHEKIMLANGELLRRSLGKSSMPLSFY